MSAQNSSSITSPRSEGSPSGSAPSPVTSTPGTSAPVTSKSSSRKFYRRDAEEMLVKPRKPKEHERVPTGYPKNSRPVEKTIYDVMHNALESKEKK